MCACRCGRLRGWRGTMLNADTARPSPHTPSKAALAGRLAIPCQQGQPALPHLPAEPSTHMSGAHEVPLVPAPLPAGDH